MFAALFIINPNVTVEFLSFDIMMTDELVGVGESNVVGESTSVDGNFLINETRPPLVVKPPYQLMYLLVITTDYVLDIDDTMDITFKLSAFINISDTVIMSVLDSNVILHKISK